MITLLAIGKKNDTWVTPGIERYQSRLKAPFNIEWALLPHSALEGASARLEESERIISKLKPHDFVVLLDEVGSNLSSPQLSILLHDQFAHSRPIVIVIGGAYGVNDALRTRANIIWSLSNLVFPHQLVRLILIEQLYRAQEIERGSSYHHS